MSHPLDGLEPAILWKHFRALTEIPRCSKGEQRAVAYVEEVAARHGCEVRRDGVGNLVVAVPASPGREGEPITILQGHLDMVCEKDSGSAHDFARDPLALRREGDYLYATGTTLGADNGVGVAAGLALVEDRSVEHGPLELLFTVDEEGGLTGANGLDPSIMKGRRLLNLDTEEDGALYVGCAGGENLHLSLPLERGTASAGTVPVRLRVSGLRGGHSGVDIHENRANAVKLLVRALRLALGEGIGLEVVSLAGGNKHNAIPREAEAHLRVRGADRRKLDEAVARAADAFRRDYGAVDPDLALQANDEEEPPDGARPWTGDTTRRVLAALAACPSGVLALSREVPGLVETSNNLGVAVTEGNRLKVITLARSFVAAALAGAQDQVRASFEPAAAEVAVGGGYPNWQPDMASPVLKAARGVFERLFGKPPAIKAIHAGLECGVIGQKVAGMDMVSFGPQIENPHSPGERLHVPSVPRFWQLVGGILAELR